LVDQNFQERIRGRLSVISRRGGDELEDNRRDNHWKLLADPDPESHPCERKRKGNSFNKFSGYYYV
jgi:hypothetical protein